MQSLETLNLSKNQLTKIPLELADSTSITELFFNDNNLIEVPTKIMAMQNLKIIEAERKWPLIQVKCSVSFTPANKIVGDNNNQEIK